MLENYRFHGVKGMRDVFPDDAQHYQQIMATARAFFRLHDLGEIMTPVVEHTLLFERGVGEGTDIVNKEMFYVPAKDKEGEAGDNSQMVLRPEATASVARAYIEHEMHKQSPGLKRYFYMGPMFRYERPQRGRLRQFTQIGAEFVGSPAAALDAEAMAMLVALLRRLHVTGVQVELNSVGCRVCRPGYSQRLRKYAREHAGELCQDCRQRMHKNPLRLFDCKQPRCRAIMQQAPDIQDSLCGDCRGHQQEVTRHLDALAVTYRINPRLMRGLDYYTRTVFEVTADNLGAQNAVAAGGRYDHLLLDLEGPDLPAIGWSMGLERAMELIDPVFYHPRRPDVLVVAPGEDRLQTLQQVMELRQQGLAVGYDHEPKSTKALMKKADKIQAAYALFVDPGEALHVELKNMASGEQRKMPWSEVADFVKRRQERVG